MAKVCEICGKKPGSGHTVSHAQNRTKRRWNPNLQSARVKIDGVPRRISICTSCLKAGKVRKNVRKTS